MASVDQKPTSPSTSTSASQRAADESDLDPAAFLKSVRELSEKREREDVERYRKLEEDIERGRQERAARRAERAKSISPEKGSAVPLRPSSSSNVNTITSPSPPKTPPPPSAEMDSSSISKPLTDNIPEFQGFRSNSKSKSSTPSTQSPATMSDYSVSTSKPSPSASSLARSGTLSWQQRPSSRGAGSRPRSMVSIESIAHGRSTPTEQSQPSRDQISEALGARDPSWFRQTADRGAGNAAYRKSKDETASGESFISGRRGLPGMSRETSTETANEAGSVPSPSIASHTASRTGSIRDSAISSDNFSTTRTSTSSKPDLKALVAAHADQEKASPMSEQVSSNSNIEESSLGRTLTMSSSQARLASTIERPASPTKTAGGFVQSAMMKRSDSANKRWSAQPATSISRQNSATSARSGYGGLTGSHSMPKLEPLPSSRETTNEPSSRPISSSNLTNLVMTPSDDKDVFVKPALPSHSRSKSVASSYSTTAEEGHTSPPLSPSKRWSPSKSSWLESAITKPDSPKPASTARNSQPSWMADIAKAKAQRASADSTPKPPEDVGSRSSSPTKAMFGQSILKRSESRELTTPRTGTPRPMDDLTPRSRSPITTTTDQSVLTRSETRDLALGSADLRDVQTKEEGVAEKTLSTGKPEPKPENTVNEDVKVQPSSQPSANAGEVAKPQAQTEKPSERASTSVNSSSLTSIAKPKPETPPKPPTDFRSNLRSRGPSEAKHQETPEFLSKFGTLKKTQTQNYVAPDVLKDNILRGKLDLAKTSGPVKTQRRDELKESLLAKKNQWKKEKDEGIVHERKVSGPPPQTPQKPEALAKRDLLGRSDSAKATSSPEKQKTATPEALARHRSLNQKPVPEPSLPTLEKQTSAPTKSSSGPDLPQPKKQTSTPLSNANEAVYRQPTEASKIAARFNPGLAGILARGPPAATSGSYTETRSESVAIAGRTVTPMASPPSEPPAEGAQLQDMRKGRARGPKRRKGGAKDQETEEVAAVEPVSTLEASTSRSAPSAEISVSEPEHTSEPADNRPKPKPRALPGSAASIMMSSLQQPPAPTQQSAEQTNPASSFKRPAVATMNKSDSRPSTPAKNLSISSPKIGQAKSAPVTQSPAVLPDSTPAENKSSDASQNGGVPEFRGFGSIKRSGPGTRQLEENKENAGEGSPSVKSAISSWVSKSSSNKPEVPAQIQLPSKKDEEAAMRSAGLLASSPSRPGSRNGLGIALEKSNGGVQTPPASANAPPKPTKPSRSVSGQLREASPNKGSSSSFQERESLTERQLANAFGSVPRSRGPLMIDTPAAIANTPHQERTFRTIRKFVQISAQDGSLAQLPPHEEYTFFDGSVYIIHHSYSVADGPKKVEIFLWAGSSSSAAAVDHAQVGARKLAKEAGNVFVHTVRQGLEPPGFLQTLGGILVTRRGSRERAAKQYMLCGRKHLGQIVFDEVDFGVDSLCSGFAYIIFYPRTLQETKLYLWKGSASATEEISAGRLTAIDLSETGEIIEVDDGAEFASFLKIFGPGTTKASIPTAPETLAQKALAPEKFTTRLFRIQPAEVRGGLFTNIFNRRPSWSGISPSRRQEDEVKVEAKEISPFTQSDLEADCIYLFDAYAEVYILVGPMFASQPENLRTTLLPQALLFASEYAVLAASTEDRSSVPKASILLSGVPVDLKVLFRHGDDTVGLWGTGSLMAGSRMSEHSQVEVLDLNEALEVVCRR